MKKLRTENKVDELRQALEKRRERAEETAPEDEAGQEGAEGTAAPQDQNQDKLLRVLAEFENFKRRSSRELEERTRYANEKLLAELLPIVDDLDRVLDHIAPDAGEEVKRFAQGVELTRKTMVAMLARHHVTEVPAVDAPFDPSIHEAIAAIESDGREPGTVAAVHRRGYRLGERLLRPALVTVTK